MHNLVSIVNSFLLPIILFSFHSIILSQTYSVKGQFVASGLTSNDIPDNWKSYESVIGYIPTLSLAKEISTDKLFDAEWAYHLKRYYTGDSLFNNNENDEIIHVGIILKNNHIIHASGKVRIDRIDHSGIYNNDLNKHTHSLRYIKKII